MPNNLFAVRLAGLAFLAGVALTITFHQLEIKESATIIAVLLVPLLVYGIAAGKILELSAPGGWTAKFQEVVQQKISTTAQSIAEDARELVAVPKVDEEELKRVVQTLERGKPIALTLFWSKEGYQQLYTVKLYLAELRQIDPAIMVIMVDEKTKRFKCMVEGNTFANLLISEDQRLIDAINDGQEDYLKQINARRQAPAFIFRKLTKKTTNADALREMKQLDIKKIVVVNDDEIPVAVVARDDIVAHVVEQLASTESEAPSSKQLSAAKAKGS